MGLEYYMFAIFVFVLVVIVALLVIKGMQKNKSRQMAEMEEKERKIMMMYTEVEEFLEGVEEYMGRSKEELEQQRLIINKELVEMRKMSAVISDKIKDINTKTVIKKQNIIPRENISDMGEAHLAVAKVAESAKSNVADGKMEIIQVQSEDKRKMRLVAMDMNRKGIPLEKIAEELKISKGEVGFMLSLKFQNLQQAAE